MCTIIIQHKNYNITSLMYWICGLMFLIDLNIFFNSFLPCFIYISLMYSLLQQLLQYDDRKCTFRVKGAGTSQPYLENRLPSSAANPYLVIAATVAAGMAGVNQKLTLPKPGYFLLSITCRTI